MRFESIYRGVGGLFTGAKGPFSSYLIGLGPIKGARKPSLAALGPHHGRLKPITYPGVRGLFSGLEAHFGPIMSIWGYPGAYLRGLGTYPAGSGPIKGVKGPFLAYLRVWGLSRVL